MSKIGLWRRLAGQELVSTDNPFGFVQELLPQTKQPRAYFENIVTPRVEATYRALGYPVTFTPRTPYGHLLGGSNGRTLIFDCFKPLYQKYPVFTSGLMAAINKLSANPAVDTIRLYLGSPRATLEPVTPASVRYALAPCILFPNKRIRVVLDAEGNKKSESTAIVLAEAAKYGIGVDAEPGPGPDTHWSKDSTCSCLVLFKTFKDTVEKQFSVATGFDRTAKCQIRILVNNAEECDVVLLSQWYNQKLIHGVDFPLDTPVEVLKTFDRLITPVIS